MSVPLFSLIDPAPPGFEPRAPSKRELLSGVVGVFAESVSEASQLLEGFQSRVSGLVFTSGAEFSHTRLAPGLSHLVVTPGQLPQLGPLAVSVLDLMTDGQDAREQNASLAIELRRARDKQERTQKGYNRSIERLGSKVAEIRQVIQHSTVGVFRADFSGRIVLANPALLRITGYPSLEALNRAEFLGTADSGAPLKPILEQAAVGPVQDLHTQIARADGAKLDVLVSVYSVSGTDPGSELLQGNISDISELERAQQEKLALERQVQHAQKLESLGILAGGIAHDFNNLLMVIMGNADLALAQIEPTTGATQMLQEIQRASARAAELAQQMLAYSGKGRFNIEQIDAGRLVHEMSHLLEVAISKKAVLRRELSDDLPGFDGDATQVRQIVMNMITNAAEALGDQVGDIVLSTGVTDCDQEYLDNANRVEPSSSDASPVPGRYVFFQVADTGSGMDAETQERIFDPFFTTKFTGRGLGLSAVLGIVRGHRGALEVRSQPGVGTVFRVLFPVSEEPSESAPLERVNAGSSAIARETSGLGTVLFADDEESVRLIGSRMLERLGFDVLTARDGREALDLFAEHRELIGAVLLDLTMPRMNGEEALLGILSQRPGTRVVLCSGYSESEATRRFAGKGLAGFIQKPFSLSSLRAKLVDTK